VVQNELSYDLRNGGGFGLEQIRDVPDKQLKVRAVFHALIFKKPSV
jgi:hypothetical protein